MENMIFSVVARFLLLAVGGQHFLFYVAICHDFDSSEPEELEKMLDFCVC